ncbi:hypothetical protein J4433_00325 [Candidatus Pacearchaeota archaeon]|nr:hypothetical protein [Candidatus Pacearchaeota archaeon]
MADKKRSEDIGDMSAGNIIQFLKENNIDDFEYCENDRKIAVKYQAAGKTAQKEQAKQQETKPEKMQAETKNLPEFYILKSLHVGYCHLQGRSKGSEEIEQFAEPCKKGGLEDILGIVKCMKGQIQYEIKLCDYKDFSGSYGIVEEIFVEHEQAVEYGMPLMKIKPCLE